MALRQQLNLKLTQRLVLTPKMRQALYILQLPLMELRRYLQEKMIENPLLEEGEQSEYEVKPEAQREELVDNLVKNEELASDYQNVDIDNSAYAQGELQKKKTYQESLLQYAPSLQEYLLQQLSLSGCTPEVYHIGQFIIGNIDENGYLQTALDEISEILDVAVADIQGVLQLIQSFDPPGIGAQNLQQCLLIQLKQKNLQDSLAAKIVSDYLTDLEKKKYEHLTRVFKVPLEKIEEAIKIISALEPKPGGPYAQNTNTYIKPDIILQKHKEKYELVLNDDDLPTLRISAQYKKLLGDTHVNEAAKSYLKEQLNSAAWLIKTVTQRQSTLLKVTRYLVEQQKEFLDKGERYLRPLTIEQIATAVERDKSTISRVLANKYMQTPFGIFAFRDFLSQGVKGGEGKIISTKHIKAHIEDLIKAEDPQHPLTDEKIVETLKGKQNIAIARRTCAKYREQLKILPANLRKRNST
ncbi:MAG: RNA polymerase factor sigma-54 [Candidatus Omnitrophota bacterium]